MKLPGSKLLVLIILPVLAGVFLILAGLYVLHSTFSHSSESQIVVIPQGRSVRGISLLLQERGIVSNASLFVAAVRLWGREGDLRAGRYTFPPRNSIASVIRKLTEGEMEYVKVTIPEGFNTWEIASRLQAEAAIDSQRFVDLAHDHLFIKALGIEAETLEGYLFPNTYIVYFEMDPEDIILRMTDAFRSVFTEQYVLRAGQLGLTVGEILALASIIEEEARVAEERPVISAVYHNRLRIGRPLEADPTVQYALGVRKPRLFEADLRVPSPYNTYLHAGLPPGPICNPGKASIEAALYPATADYLYFVAQGDGRHAFTRSFDQHVQAKNRIRKANNLQRMQHEK